MLSTDILGGPSVVGDGFNAASKNTADRDQERAEDGPHGRDFIESNVPDDCRENEPSIVDWTDY